MLVKLDPHDTCTPHTYVRVRKSAVHIAVLLEASKDCLAGRLRLTSTLAVEESVFETLRIKRYGRLVVLLTPALKIISYDFDMLGYDYSVPQPVILNELGALMQQFQHYQQTAAATELPEGPKLHDVMRIAVNALASLGHGFEGEVGGSLPKEHVSCIDTVNSALPMIGATVKYKGHDSTQCQ